MGLQTGSMSLETSLKRSSSSRPNVITDRVEMDITPTPQTPFNSTSFLIRQQSQHRQEQAACLPIFDIFEDLHIYQYGSNSNSMIACCTFDSNRHDLSRGYKSQADHPVITGTESRDHSPCHHYHSSNGARSAGRRKREDGDPSAEDEIRGRERLKQRRTQSFQDDNFALLQANLSRAKTVDEFIDENLINNFCTLEI